MENHVLDNDLQVLSEEQNKLKPKFAGFWIRVGASLVDFVVYLPLMALSMYNTYSLKNFQVQIVIYLLLTVYKPFMEYKYGATLGKMAVKIKVVDLNLGSITLSQSMIRYFPWVLSQGLSFVTAILLFQNESFQSAESMMEVAALQSQVISPVLNYVTTGVFFVSCIAMAFSDEKQALHDKAAKTYCVYRA
jgi:uncharacterized RDD family membrane protein YckC